MKADNYFTIFTFLLIQLTNCSFVLVNNLSSQKYNHKKGALVYFGKATEIEQSNHQIDINAKLYDAILNVQVDSVKEILKKGANPNELYGFVYRDQVPIYFFAIIKNDLNALKVLKEFGADFKITDRKENTALHFAISFRCSFEILNYLIVNGINVNKKNVCGESVIFNIFMKCNYDQNGRYRNFFYSEELDRIYFKSIFNWLVNHGSEINYINIFGENILFLTKDTEYALFLLKNGVNPIPHDSFGEYLYFNLGLWELIPCDLFPDTLRGKLRFELLQTLLEKGLNPNQKKRNEDNTILHHVIKSYDIQNRANIDYIECVRQGFIKELVLLLEYRADLQLKGYDGISAFQIIVSLKDKEIINLCEKYIKKD